MTPTPLPPPGDAETTALSIDSDHVRAVRSYQVRTFEVFVAQASMLQVDTQRIEALTRHDPGREPMGYGEPAQRHVSTEGHPATSEPVLRLAQRQGRRQASAAVPEDFET